MACTMQVLINIGGTQVPSILYDNLRDAAKDTKTANKWYNAITSEEFKKSPLYSKLEFDKNGEPTFESLYVNGFRELVDKYSLARAYTKRLGGYSGNNTRFIEAGSNNKVMDLFESARKFNDNPSNKDFVAVVMISTSKKDGFSKGNPGMYIRVEPLSEGSAIERYATVYKEKMNRYVQNLNKLLSIPSIDKDLLNSVAKSSRFYNVYTADTYSSIEKFDPDRILRFFAASLNVIEDNVDEPIKARLDLREDSEHFQIELHSIANRITDFAESKKRSSDNTYFDSFSNILKDENISGLFFTEEAGYLSNSELASDDKIRHLFVRLMENRLKDSNYRTNVEEIDNLLFSQNGLLSFFKKDCKIAEQLSDVRTIVLDTAKRKYEVSFDDFEKNDVYDEYAKFMKSQVKEAKDKISEIDDYQDKIDAIVQSIRNVEFRYKHFLENNKIDRGDDVEDLDSIEYANRIIRQLSIAKANGEEAMGIYQYIIDITDRIDALGKMIARVDVKNPSMTKQNAQTLKRIFDFGNAYNDVMDYIRAIIIDGSTFSNSLIDGSIELLPELMEDSGILPNDMKELRKELKNGREYIIENIDSLSDKLKTFIKWKYSKSTRYRGNDREVNMMLRERDLKQLDALVFAINAAKVSDISKKQEMITRALNIQQNAINNLMSSYKNKARAVFSNFLKSYMDEEQKVVRFGEFMGFKKGEEIDIDKLLKTTQKDINGYQRWLSSMSQAPDIILNLTDRAVKTAREEARMRYMEDVENIKREAKILENAGIKDTEWMFEVDEKGHKTGYYVHSNIEMDAYDWMMEQQYIRKKLGLGRNDTYNPLNCTDEQNKFFEEQFKKAVAATKAAIKGGYSEIKESEQYKKIMLDPAKKRYFEFFTKTYRKYQSFYPSSCVKKNRCIGVRKDKYESVVTTEGLGNKAKQWWGACVADFARTYDDEFSTMRTDLKGEEIRMLPIYYSYFEDDEVDTLTTDCTSALLKFGSKAFVYDSFTNIVDAIEIGREVLKDREIWQYRGLRPIVTDKEKAKEAKEAGDREAYEKLVMKKPAGTEANFCKLYADYVEAQIYGLTSKLEKEFTISKDTPLIGRFVKKDMSVPMNKITQWLNAKTAKAALNFNAFNGMSNILTGETLRLIQSLGNRYFNPIDWAWAMKEYALHSVNIIAQSRARIKTDKVALICELFDTQNEYNKENSDIEWEKNVIVRIFGKGIGSVFQNAGEHMMSTQVALAVLKEVIIDDGNGGKTNLYDALEVEFIGEDGKAVTSDQGYGARLKLNDDVKKAMDKKLEKGECVVQFHNEQMPVKSFNDLVFRVHNRINGINHQMDGIYNTEDANAIQRYAIMSMAYLFRRWIPASINRIAGKIYYDPDTQTWREGEWRTVGRLMVEFAKELKNGREAIIEHWKDLSEEEKQNLKKCAYEWALLVSLIFANGFIFGDDDDYSKEVRESYTYKVAKLAAYRLQSELQSQIPNTGIISEAYRIFKSPVVCIRTLEGIVNTINILSPWQWGVFDSYKHEHMIKEGALKGYPKAVKYIVYNPVITGYVGTQIKSWSDIGSLINFYKDN